MKLTRDVICNMIPHAGLMCLIDAVESWDEDTITCVSHSHLQNNNPLRSNGKLLTVQAIEYGAQAMAIHGALLTKNNHKPMPPGYLAAARDVKFGSMQRLDTLELPLRIHAKKMLSSGGNLMYSFEIHAGDEPVISARLTVAAQVDN